MSEYKRLTKIKATSENTFPVYDMNGNIIMDKELFDDFIKEHNRLAELEDDLESGKLIRLPCKVGDTVYLIDTYNMEVMEWYFGFDMLGSIGKTVFLTKDEAEDKLKELEE
jgi:hypothetical protein